jgi:tetratricopeptide (TPR) repeat protein
MTVRAALVVVAVSLLAVFARADNNSHHPAGHDKGSPAMAAAVPETAGCGAGDPCYTPAELAEVKSQLARQYPYVKVEPVIDGRSAQAPVTRSDIDQLRGYFGAEQLGMQALKERVTPAQWSIIQHGQPDQISAVFRSLPLRDRQALLPFAREIKSEMRTLMQKGDVNPFHESLAKHDVIAQKIMSRLDGPVMTGPQWQAAEPGNSSGYNYGAQESLERGDPRAAAEQARQALALDPRNAEAFSLLSAAEYDMKQWGEASGAAKKALELDPNDARAQTVLKLAHDPLSGNLAARGGAEREAAALEPAWRGSQEMEAPQALRADGFARQAEQALSVGDYALASARADAALGVDPRFAYAYGLKAFASIKAGRAAQGLNDAVAGLGIDPHEAMAQKARAQALLRLGRYQEALAAALAAGRDDPKSGLARYFEAAARSGLGDRQGALDALRAAAALDARYAPLLDAALQLPKDADMALLFKDDAPRGAGALAAAGSPRSRRLSIVLAAALAGGGLLAFGFLRLFGGRMRQALTTVFTRVPEAAPAKQALAGGHYRTLRQIGAGGMGMVYEATDLSLDRRVAIKKMRDELRVDPRERQRFVSEARLVAALRHPNIVEIYSIVDQDDELALVFEYVSGQTLHEAISARGRLSFAEAMSVYRGMSAALECAHARGIIHRDLKPSNVMINDEGVAKVMDFGIARAAKDALTRFSMTNTIVGTPPYMAPEQEQGVVRKESDVYALGVCLYEMLSGALPFAGGSAGGILMSKINKSYTPASRVVEGLPEGVDAVFDKVLEPDPERRYRSVAELRQALESLRVPA